MKKPKLSIVLLFLLVCCTKERYVFTMKSVRLNAYHKSIDVTQRLYIKVVNADNPEIVFATTDSYPSDLPLPVLFAVTPRPELRLYQQDHVAIELWGESTGRIASGTVSMDNYKIRFPVDMETAGDGVSFSVMGNW